MKSRRNSKEKPKPKEKELRCIICSEPLNLMPITLQQAECNICGTKYWFADRKTKNEEYEVIDKKLSGWLGEPITKTKTRKVEIGWKLKKEYAPQVKREAIPLLRKAWVYFKRNRKVYEKIAERILGDNTPEDMFNIKIHHIDKGLDGWLIKIGTGD